MALILQAYFDPDNKSAQEALSDLQVVADALKLPQQSLTKLQELVNTVYSWDIPLMDKADYLEGITARTVNLIQDSNESAALRFLDRDLKTAQERSTKLIRSPSKREEMVLPGEVLQEPSSEKPTTTPDPYKGLAKKPKSIDKQLEEEEMLGSNPEDVEQLSEEPLLEKIKERETGSSEELEEEYKHLEKELSKGLSKQEKEITQERLTQIKQQLKGKSNLFGDTKMEKQGKYFEHYREFDQTGGVWELDKESKKIRRKKSDRLERQEFLQEAMTKGGVWDYEVGQDGLFLETDFGFTPVTIKAQLPGRRYKVASKQSDYEVHECELFDCDPLEDLYNV